MFSTLYNVFIEYISEVFGAFQLLFDAFFYKTFGELLVPSSAPDWWANLIANIPVEFLNTTLISFVLGAGILIFISLTIIKWFLDIFT